MSLVNQALQKVSAQQAMQQALNAPMPSYMASPRRASVGFWPVFLAILLVGSPLATWWGLGALRANRAQAVSLPEPAATKITVITAPAASPAPVIENLKPLDTPKPNDTTPAAADLQHMIAGQSAAEMKQAPSIVASAVLPSVDPTPTLVAPVLPLAAEPTKATIDTATPSILKSPVVARMAEAQPAIAPAPIAPAPTTPEPARPKEPVLLNAQTLDVPGANKIKLMAVSQTSDGWSAVINDTIVSEGDEVGSATVVSIAEKRVKLKIDQKTYTLRLP